MAISVEHIEIKYSLLCTSDEGAAKRKSTRRRTAPGVDYYEELTDKHHFSLPVNRLTVAIDSDFRAMGSTAEK